MPCPRLVPLERRNCTFQPSHPPVLEILADAPGAAGAVTSQKNPKLTLSHCHARMTQRPGKQSHLRIIPIYTLIPANVLLLSRGIFLFPRKWSMGVWLLEKTQPQLQGICSLPYFHNLDGRRKPSLGGAERFALVETQVIRSWQPWPERFGDFHTCDAVVTTGTLRKTKNSLNIPASQLRHPRANPLCWHDISIPNAAEDPIGKSSHIIQALPLAISWAGAEPPSFMPKQEEGKEAVRDAEIIQRVKSRDTSRHLPLLQEASRRGFSSRAKPMGEEEARILWLA